ncbi:MAG TPA: hypothetical protein VEZ20_03575 [Allosphingosinicella sp.]|jgi:hypothetical protein|nr:hypothetical protein [Allosphingosinicella sp.]
MAHTPPEPGYDALLHFCCVRLGYCGSVRDGEPLQVDMLLPEEGRVTADRFADLVFEAEQIEPGADESSRKQWRAIRAAFIEHLGADSVDAEALMYGWEKREGYVARNRT